MKLPYVWVLSALFETHISYPSFMYHNGSVCHRIWAWAPDSPVTPTDFYTRSNDPVYTIEFDHSDKYFYFATATGIYSAPLKIGGSVQTVVYGLVDNVTGKMYRKCYDYKLACVRTRHVCS